MNKNYVYNDNIPQLPKNIEDWVDDFLSRMPTDGQYRNNAAKARELYLDCVKNGTEIRNELAPFKRETETRLAGKPLLGLPGISLNTADDTAKENQKKIFGEEHLSRKRAQFHSFKLITFSPDYTPTFLVDEPEVHELSDWLVKNMPRGRFNLALIRRAFNGTDQLPHIDYFRTYNYNYLLHAGGDNVLTTWYNVKPEFKHETVCYGLINPFHKLTEIEHVRFETRRWHELHIGAPLVEWTGTDPELIHGVSQIQTTRVALTLLHVPNVDFDF
jgi:hypothetical protein